ncbi:MAG TPA: FAD-binding and (Fe-S)-binding domain-containing protein [Vicinamibacterales bacterium]|nr:FAD-binding and (Fe-S)-binding domain-containing protein [Vicinamibacterales bacterium]
MTSIGSEAPRTIDAPRATTATDVAALRRALEAQVQGEIRFDKVSRALYSTDASVYQIEPLAVVVPRSRDDLLTVVRICARFRCPLTMRGGGTSQAGQAIGPGLIVDTSKYLNALLELNVAERWARVEPGLVLDELNARLRPHGLRFAPDVSTASRATVGGMMANNSSGARSVLYGKTIDHVIEQEVVLSDGSIASFKPMTADEVRLACASPSLEGACYRVTQELAQRLRDEIDRRYPKVLRRVAGYNLDEFVKPERPFNLAKLMVGSEGTLGVVLSAKLNLVPLPNAKSVLAIQFASLSESLTAAPLVLRHRPSAVEVMDRFILDHTRQSPALHALRQSFIDGEPESLLCVEFYADRPEDLPPRMQALERDLREASLGYRYYHALDAAAQARIWSLREAALGLSMAMKGDLKSLSFVEDTAVAPEQLRDYIEQFLTIVGRHGTSAGVYAHASVGCLHVRPVVNMKTEAGVRTFAAIANDVSDLVLRYGGALSGEHGDGLVRSPFMRKMFGPELYEAFRTIKRTFDPDGIFNPGKIVDAPPLTDNLRFGPAYSAAQPVTFFDYADHGGMAGAVEMCSGLGVCRKTLEGTMCPSYMATREEQHSTRGRADVLRLTMAGRLGEAGLGDAGVYETLDLCLECRACKAECPVGVDVARFKSEFLADYWRRNGTALDARVLGRARSLARWGSRLAPFSNWVAGNRAVRVLNERLLGIDRRRRLPRFRRRTLEHQVSPTGRARSLLFVDTFTNHYDPEIGLAALGVLGAVGLRPALARNHCCGRPQISKGLLDEARGLAERNAEALYPGAAAGCPIVFCEPGCLSAVREDAPSLLRGEMRRRAEVVAAASVLFEEALAPHLSRLTLERGPSNILFHAHCHQKSMGLTGASLQVLGAIPGAKVVNLDAGCCGMAGSFGYARDHYDVSRAIGERRLLPAVRSKPLGSIVVATGTSCRHQIRDFGDDVAVHPAVLIRSLLKAPPASAAESPAAASRHPLAP